MIEDPNVLQTLNHTELMEIIRRQTGLVVKRSVPRERMVQFLQSGVQFSPEELSPTTDSRKRLQLYIEKNWVALNSQLPCKGENKGRCTIYPCPEGRHVDCLLQAAPHMTAHAL